MLQYCESQFRQKAKFRMMPSYPRYRSNQKNNPEQQEKTESKTTRRSSNFKSPQNIPKKTDRDVNLIRRADNVRRGTRVQQSAKQQQNCVSNPTTPLQKVQQPPQNPNVHFGTTRDISQKANYLSSSEKPRNKLNDKNQFFGNHEKSEKHFALGKDMKEALKHLQKSNTKPISQKEHQQYGRLLTRELSRLKKFNQAEKNKQQSTEDVEQLLQTLSKVIKYGALGSEITTHDLAEQLKRQKPSLRKISSNKPPRSPPHDPIIQDQLQISRKRLKQLQNRNREIEKKFQFENMLVEKLKEINEKIEENKNWRQNLASLKSTQGLRNTILGPIIFSLLFKLRNLSEEHLNLTKTLKLVLQIVNRKSMNKTRKKVQIHKLMNKIGVVDEEVVDGFFNLIPGEKKQQSIEKYQKEARQHRKLLDEHLKTIQQQSKIIMEKQSKITDLVAENQELKVQEKMHAEMIEQLASLQKDMKDQLQSVRKQIVSKEQEWLRKEELLRETIKMGQLSKTPPPHSKQTEDIHRYSGIDILNNENFMIEPKDTHQISSEFVVRSFQSQNISETFSQVVEESAVQNIFDGSLEFKIRMANPKDDLFNDPKSPYATAPPYVKALFVQEAFRKLAIKEFDDNLFEFKRGPTNICTKILRPGDRFYVCEQCSLNSDEAYRVVCPQCWQQSAHIGHSYTSGTLRQFPGRIAIVPFIICDCGKKQHIKQQSFCSNHKDSRELHAQISQQTRKKFFQFFQTVFYIAFYLRRNPHKSEQSNKPYNDLLDKIKIYVSQLCHRSIYYIRLTTEVLEKMIIDEKNEKVKILDFLIREKINMDLMFLIMLGDKMFKEKLARAVIKYQQNEFDVINYQMIVDEDLNYKLAEQSLFFGDSFSSKYLNNSKLSQKSKIIFMKYLHYKTDNDKKFPNLMIKLLQDQIFPVPLNKSIYMLDDLPLVRKIIIKFFEAYEQEKQNEETPVYLEQDEIRIDDSSLLEKSSETKNYCTAILYFLSIYLKSKEIKFEELDNIQQILSEELSINETQFIKFIRVAVSNIKEILNDTYTKQQWLVILLIKMIHNLQQTHPTQCLLMIQQLWNKLLKTNQRNFRSRGNIITILDRFYQIISLVANCRQYPKIYFGEEQHLSDEYREEWFKSYLYQNKIISRNQMLKFRARGELNFTNAKNILKETCRFNEEAEQFEFVAEEKYPNYLLRFRIRDHPDRDKLQNIYNPRFRLKEDIVYKDGIEKDFFKMIFNDERMIQQLCKKVQDYVEPKKSIAKQILKEHQFGYYFCLLLVCIDKLTQESNEAVKKQLQKIIENKQVIQGLIQMTSIRSIPQLLCLKQEEQCKKQEKAKSQLPELQHKISEEGNKAQSEVRKRSLQKKMQKYAKIKQKREKVLRNRGHDFEEVQRTDENECLICHERGTNKNLVYLAEINNKTISSSFHGKDNKTSTLIDSCFHAVHVDCYMNLVQEQRFEYTCPLCSQIRNIILPQNLEDTRTLTQCQNSINAFYVIKMKMMNFNGIMPILFKHLVESLGLHSLVSIYLYDSDKSKRLKNEKYAYQLLTKVYEASSPQKKSEFTRFYNQLVSQIEKCQNKTIRDLQMLISEIVYNRIVKNRVVYDRERLISLKKILVKDEYEVVKGSLFDFLGEDVDQQESKDINQIKLQNNEELQEIHDRESLSFQFKTPPPNASLVENFGSLKCCFCNKNNREMVCLICGRQICNSSSCSGFQEHQAMHNSNYLCLMVKQAVVTIYRMRSGITMKISAPLYYNFLMVPYHSRRNNEDPEQFEFRSEQFQKIITFFFMP